MNKLLKVLLVTSIFTNCAVAYAVNFDVNKLSPQDWYKYWQGSITKLNAEEKLRIEELNYYVRVNNIDISKIKPGASTNPDNVKRIEKLMPEANFNSVFPLSNLSGVKADEFIKQKGFNPGDVYSYTNFLKAAAIIPAYCGDYSTYPANKTLEMKDPDAVCKRLLATTFAHAVQETSNIDSNEGVIRKIPGTLASIAEGDSTPTKRLAGQYLDKGGPFSESGALKAEVTGKYYYGRGIKQLSYPANYANLSSMLYGNLEFLINPDLVQENNFLPYLSAIVYTVQPKAGKPSIIEVMDGSFVRDAKNKQQNTAVQYGEMGFPYTVALVNGGPECNYSDPTTHKNLVNTQTRLNSFRAFATGEVKLLSSGFTMTNAEKNADNCYNINYSDPQITTVSKRYYYFDTAKKCSLTNWDTGLPIFGGEKFKNIFDCGKQAKYTLTIVSSNAMGIQNLKIKNVTTEAAVNWIGGNSQHELPDDTIDTSAFDDKQVSITYEPTWISIGDGKYSCPTFNFNKSTIVKINNSANASEAKCVIQ